MKNLIKLSLIIIPTIIIVVIFKKDISSLFSFYNSSDVCLDYGFDPNSKEYDKCEIFIKSITFDIECSNDIFKTSIKNLVHKECIQSKSKNNSDKIEQLYACRYEPNEDHYQSSKICFRENGIKPENRKAFNDCTKSKNSSVNECTALKRENYCENKYDDDEGRLFCADEFYKVLEKKSVRGKVNRYILRNNRRVNCLDRGFIFKSDKYYDCYYSEKSEETFDFKLEEYPQCSKNQFRHRCKDTYVDLDGRKGVYVGEWLDDKKNGQGTLTRKNGNKYVGGWLNNLRHGQGTLTLKNGDKYVGEWLNDRISGQGTYTWKNGDKYVGEWLNEKRNGQGTFTWKDGTNYVGEWLNNLRHGQGTLTRKNGNKYVGEWLDDNRSGQGTLTWKNGSKYVGEWLNNDRNGQGTLTWKNGNKYVGEWLDDKKNGQGTFTLKNGDKYVGEWVNNKIKGIKNGDYISIDEIIRLRTEEIGKAAKEKERIRLEEIRKAKEEKERLEEIRKAENKFIEVGIEDFRQQLCLEANGLSQGLADSIARKLKVSSYSISLRHVNLMKDHIKYCSAMFDTPKGPIGCSVLMLLANKKGNYILHGGCY